MTLGLILWITSSLITLLLIVAGVLLWNRKLEGVTARDAAAALVVCLFGPATVFCVAYCFFSVVYDEKSRASLGG